LYSLGCCVRLQSEQRDILKLRNTLKHVLTTDFLILANAAAAVDTSDPSSEAINNLSSLPPPRDDKVRVGLSARRGGTLQLIRLVTN
jgi:hypothetical protein